MRSNSSWAGGCTDGCRGFNSCVLWIGGDTLEMGFNRVLLDALFPLSCVLCAHSSSGALICDECRPVRARPVPFPLRSPLMEYRSLGTYEGDLGRVVRCAKYGRALALLDELGRLLGQGMMDWSGVDLVVPVPAPLSRRLIRGFDHGFRLARSAAIEVGTSVATPLQWSVAVRQVGKTAASRRMLDASAIRSRTSLDGMDIVVVDDVVTTGATLRAAASAVVAAGARSVRGISVVHVEGKGFCTRE